MQRALRFAQAIPVLVRLSHPSMARASDGRLPAFDRTVWVDDGWIRCIDCTSIPEMQRLVEYLKVR